MQLKERGRRTFSIGSNTNRPGLLGLLGLHDPNSIGDPASLPRLSLRTASGHPMLSLALTLRGRILTVDHRASAHCPHINLWEDIHSAAISASRLLTGLGVSGIWTRAVIGGERGGCAIEGERGGLARSISAAGCSCAIPDDADDTLNRAPNTPRFCNDLNAMSRCLAS